MANVTKAIIPVAGWGTRRLPITKAIEKCMLPVGNRPIVDYLVRDCIKAGIKEIYFVVNQGSTQLQQYYSDNVRLNQYLQNTGNQELMDLARPPSNVIFHFIEQDSNAKYGTAIPAALVFPHLKKGESVVFVQGDAIFHSLDDSSEIDRFIKYLPDGSAGVMASEVPMQEISRYGVIDFDDETGLFQRIVEKPPADQAPSNMINLGNYVLNYELMTYIYNFSQLQVSGEYYIIDPMAQYVLDKGVVNVYRSQTEYLDCGHVHGWLRANQLIVNRM